MNNNNVPLHVAVLHERPLLAAGILATLHQRSELRVFVVAPQSGPLELAADVVVTDDDNGLRLLAGDADGRAPRRPVKVLVVSTRSRPGDIEQALRAGAHGYMLSGCSVDELVRGIEATARGARFLCSEAARMMAEGMAFEPLTARQLEVLQLISRGLPNKTIGRHLGVSEGTVKTHVKALLAKLDVQSRTEALSVAIRRGVVSMPA